LCSPAVSKAIKIIPEASLANPSLIGFWYEKFKNNLPQCHNVSFVQKEAELETMEKSSSSTVMRLTLKQVKLTDSGVYLCTGSNKYEQVSAISKLLVWPKG